MAGMFNDRIEPGAARAPAMPHPPSQRIASR
jgi:hypothetical protein